MNWKIRQAVLEDLNTIAELDQKLYPLEGGWEYDEFYKVFIDPTTVFFVAHDNSNQIIGYALFNKLTKTQAELLANTVIPEHRGKGLGKKLLELRLERIDADRDIQETILQTRIDNYLIIELYKKYGFEPIKVLKGYYNENVDALEMVRKRKK